MKFVLKCSVDKNPAMTPIMVYIMPNRRQAIISTNPDPIYWRIYAPLRGDELLRFHSIWYVLSIDYKIFTHETGIFEWHRLLFKIQDKEIIISSFHVFSHLNHMMMGPSYSITSNGGM